jgi:hypothetical protein
MKQHQRTVGINDEWITPPEIISSLGSFDLDPCAAVNQPFITAQRQLTIDDDGLSHEWYGRVWLNPPFNRYYRPKWMKRMSDHGDGIMLVPAAMETAAFRTYVWGKADAVLFLHHRPHFHYISGERAKANSGCTICLVAYGEHNVQALINSGLGAVVKEII